LPLGEGLNPHRIPAARDALQRPAPPVSPVKPFLLRHSSS
jgi:hypothetical protein